MVAAAETQVTALSTCVEIAGDRGALCGTEGQNVQRATG